MHVVHVSFAVGPMDLLVVFVACLDIAASEEVLVTREVSLEAFEQDQAQQVVALGHTECPVYSQTEPVVASSCPYDSPAAPSVIHTA